MTNPKLLLHACCAPCSTVPLERFHEQFEIVGFFYNPNIQPHDEYTKRKAEVASYYHLQGVSLLEGENDTAVWERSVICDDKASVEPEGGSRCDRCFEYRLRRTAKEAATRGFPWFGTTLSVSPYKNTEHINAIGTALAKEYGLHFLTEDLKDNNGYQRSIELSKQAGLYRQKYCGCRFSDRKK